MDSKMTTEERTTITLNKVPGELLYTSLLGKSELRYNGEMWVFKVDGKEIMSQKSLDFLLAYEGMYGKYVIFLTDTDY